MFDTTSGILQGSLMDGLLWINSLGILPRDSIHNPREQMLDVNISILLEQRKMHGLCSPGAIDAIWERFETNGQ